jgi:hypothetical protein
MFTLIGFITAVFIVVLSNLYNIDPFDRLVKFFHSLEEYEIDEYFIAGIVFLFFWLVDLLLWKRKQSVELEKTKIYKAMIFTTHHILNNFLNQMLLFKITAEETPDFDKKILEMYDEIIDDAKKQLDALSSVTDISEHAIKRSVLPQSDNTVKC